MQAIYRWETPVYLRALACLSFDTVTGGDWERRDNPSRHLVAFSPPPSTLACQDPLPLKKYTERMILTAFKERHRRRNT